jgi:hypothetical protein
VTDGRQPWWLRALEPLRTEAAMFRLLLVVVAVVSVVVVVVLLIRAAT